jgi:hypothetical protein
VANLVAKKVELSHANHIEMKSAIKLSIPAKEIS